MNILNDTMQSLKKRLRCTLKHFSLMNTSKNQILRPKEGRGKEAYDIFGYAKGVFCFL